MVLTKYLHKYFFTFILICFSFLASGQYSQDPFGKNRLQFKQFDWKVIETANFQIHFYDGGYETALLAAQYSESEFSRVTDMVGFSPYDKVKVFVYLSISDQRQSNVGIYQQGVDAGGQTHFSRSQIEVAYTGNKHDFKEALNRSLADILIFEMMYGGNLKELLQSSYLLSLPPWFMAGASKFIAEGWSEDMDDYIRDAMGKKRLKKPHKLKGWEAEFIGQSIWNFIAKEYGEDNIANILNLTRIIRSEKNSIQNSLGISYAQFVEKWKAFYGKQFAAVDSQLVVPDKKDIFYKNKKGHTLNKVALSKDGKYMAYTLNKNGKYSVKVRKVGGSRTRTVLKGGFRVMNQPYDKDLPLIEWVDNSELAIYGVKRGKGFFWQYDFDKKKNRKEKTKFNRFNHVHHFSVSSGGKKVVFSAERDGKTDLYIYYIERNQIRQITNDPYDDLEPAFIPGTGDIIFSSNRVSDTLGGKDLYFRDISDNFNIFLYQENSPKQLKRVSNTLSSDRMPVPIDEENVLYTSDQRGIRQLYRYNLASGVASQTTNFRVGVQDYSVSNNKLGMIMYQDGDLSVMLMEDYDPFQQTFHDKTYRQNIMDMLHVEQLRDKAILSKTEPKKTALKQGELPPDEVDTDNYSFDNEASLGKRKTFLNRYNLLKERMRTMNQEVKISEPRDFESKFAVDNILTSLRVDPLLGFGAVLETGLTDMLENHKFNAGLVLLNFGSSSFFGEYEYLKHRIDFKAKFDRRSVESVGDQGEIYQQYQMDRGAITASLPLNIATRVSVTPFMAVNRYDDLHVSGIAEPSFSELYSGTRTELVFDNSKTLGMNMMKGTRFKIMFENWNNVERSGRSFSELLIDFRNYQKVVKSMVLATRVTYGQYFGESKKSYQLGGMDNWIGSDTENQEQIFPNRGGVVNEDIYFNRYITTMRGFNFNHQRGDKVLLLNAELRLPVTRFFYRGTVSSNFFRNLQLVGFADAGTAWSKGSILSDEPFKSTSRVTDKNDDGTGGPFDIEVNDYQPPFLLGYGFGLRSVLAGYYFKVDYAFANEKGIQKEAKFHVTLGFDF